MNNVVLKWTKSAEHLGNIMTYDLKNNEEINHKHNDFIRRANSVISNFRYLDKNVSSRVFCHNAVFVWISSLAIGFAVHQKFQHGLA